MAQLCRLWVKKTASRLYASLSFFFVLFVFKSLSLLFHVKPRRKLDHVIL
jgi:hypothetical protein